MVERVVGKLGSSVLVKVRHARHGGRFHLKYLTRDACAEPHAAEQFLRTARGAMRLRSEYTARTVDAGCSAGGLPYVVSESFQGSELREIVRVRCALGPAEAVDMVLQAAHAVAEAHCHRIAHGSLSPSALFLTLGPEGQPMVKVLDLGSAATLRLDPFWVRLRHWTQGTAIFSESIRLWDTVACTAPERLRGSNDPTPIGDVWALGAILYELLLGTPPFRARATPPLIAAIVADPPPTARELGRSLPQALERIVLRCLSKSPDSRYQSVQELAGALRPFASPDKRPLVDRIARLKDYDPGHAPWFTPRPQRAASHSSRPMPALAEHRAPTTRAKQRRDRASLLLVAIGAFAGVLAGTLVARGLEADDGGSRPSVPLPVSQRR